MHAVKVRLNAEILICLGCYDARAEIAVAVADMDMRGVFAVDLNDGWLRSADAEPLATPEAPLPMLVCVVPETAAANWSPVTHTLVPSDFLVQNSSATTR